jgi:hypothetical protein
MPATPYLHLILVYCPNRHVRTLSAISAVNVEPGGGADTLTRQQSDLVARRVHRRNLDQVDDADHGVADRHPPGVRRWHDPVMAGENHDTGMVLASGTSAASGVITFTPTSLRKITFVVLRATGAPRVGEFETFSGN